MNITEQEAWLIVGAMDVARVAHDHSDEDLALIARIRSEFPAINDTLVREETRAHVWSVVVEDDPRVIDIRTRLAVVQEAMEAHVGRKTFDSYSDVALALSNELHRVKQEVYDEIAPSLPPPPMN